MEIKKAINVMKVLVLLAGIFFLIMYTSFETNDCGMCSFDGKKIGKFMETYQSECLEVEKGLPNILENQPTNEYGKSPN